MSSPDEPGQRSSKRRRTKTTRYEAESHTNEEELWIQQAIKQSKIETRREHVDVPLAPVFYPTQEEFIDPVLYIAKIREQAEPFGICKIVPPAAWKPQCQVDMNNTADFPTKSQPIHTLQQGQPFDDGRRFNIATYKKMADEFYDEWVRKHHSEDSAGADAGAGGGVGAGTQGTQEQRGQGGQGQSSAGKSSSRKEASLEALAKDYWYMVETSAREVEVEYGNDLDTTKYASGFFRPMDRVAGNGSKSGNGAGGEGSGSKGRGTTTPPSSSSLISSPAEQGKAGAEAGVGVGAGAGAGAEGCVKEKLQFDEEFYRSTGWNLNNLPTSKGSVLEHLRTSINGINVPWLYIGMLFSSFCWHNEDNYFYSINYAHFGAPKQWYGVPGNAAEIFEKVTRESLLGSFRESPDLLHHMTTQISPSLLVRSNVPVYQITHEPGSFIITFPKSFHAGFSYGFNVGEAVNFASHDWLLRGSEAEQRYRHFARESVFSHQRLLFTLLNHSQDMTKVSLLNLSTEVVRVMDEELATRPYIYKRGVKNLSSQIQLPPNDFACIDEAASTFDDMRMCGGCKQVCVFSAVACKCDRERVACIRCFEKMCKCPMNDKFLLEWASDSELRAMREKALKLR